jgi:5-methylthioadenosine/S-adenosylhomocysteine deaminase
VIVYEADWLCPATSPPIPAGGLQVDNGRISKVGIAAKIPGTPRVRFPGCAIVPGFVNAHAHLELTIFRGLFENLAFTDWIQNLVRLKYQVLTREDFRISAQLGAMEMLRAGVTTVAEVMDIGTGWEAMQQFGLQGIAYQEVFGPAESAVAEAMKSLQGKIETCRAGESESARIGVSPHAPYTVSAPLYKAVAAYARQETLRLSAHVAESRAETQFVRDGGGPFAAAHAQRGIEVTARHCLPVDYLARLGLLGPDVLLVHGIETADRDLDLLRDSGTFVAHCPKSNAKLGHATAQIAAMRSRGVPVTLGTDSVASNNVIDMFEEMRAAVFQQRTLTGRVDALGAADAFRMATIAGAEAMGLQEHLGSLEPGKRADFAVVDLGHCATQPVYDPVETMVYSASRNDVRSVFLAGREVSIDDSELVARAAERARSLKS